MRSRGGRPAVITDAEPSQQEQLRIRQNRYIAMMSIRVMCLLIGAALVSARVPLLWLWLAMCAAGMIVIPWVAVVLANDRLPKEEHRWRRPRRRTPRQLPTGPEAGPARPDRMTIEGRPGVPPAGP